MKKFRAVVRSISPFTKGKTTSHSDEVQSVISEDIPLPDWDLSNVNFEVLLTHFYQAYNPTRMDSIGAILEQYRGDEVIMLLQLAERYNLSQSEMKQFIEQSRELKEAAKRDVSTTTKAATTATKPATTTSSPASAPMQDAKPASTTASRPDEAVEWRLPVRQRRPDASSSSNNTTPMTTARSQTHKEEESAYGSSKFTPKPIVSEPSPVVPAFTSMSLQDIIRASRAATNPTTTITTTNDEDDHVSDEESTLDVPITSPVAEPKKTSNGLKHSPKPVATLPSTISSTDNTMLTKLQTEISTLKDKLLLVETEKEELQSLLLLLVEEKHSNSALDALEAYLVRKGLKQREQLGGTAPSSTSSEDENNENDPAAAAMSYPQHQTDDNEYEHFHYSYQHPSSTININQTPLSRDKLRLHSLEGGRVEYQRNSSPSVRSLPANSTSSYMLGTKASTSRVKDIAHQGRNSGKFSPYRFTTTTTSSNRPTSASSRSSRSSSGTNRSRARSASPAHSYNSDAITSTYQSAKKYLNHSTKQAQKSYAANTTNFEIKTRQLAEEKQKAITATNSNIIADPPEGWVTCFDPKSKQKYYYNAKLKKSVWKLPTASAATNPEPHFSWSPQATTVAASIPSIPTPSVASRSSTPSSRHSSPAKSTASVSSKRSSSNLQVVAGVPWLMATDPKSGKPYWYNKATRVSTWKKPEGFIV